MLDQHNTTALFIDIQERMMPAIKGHEEIERKCAILAKAARLLKLPVLVTRQYPKGLGDTLPSLREALGEHTACDKMSFSCLGEDNGFREKIVRQNVIVAGVETHICVQQTVLDLISCGFIPCIAADCCGSRSDIDYKTALVRMGSAGAVITTLESILFEIMHTAEHPARKEIQGLIK